MVAVNNLNLSVQSKPVSCTVEKHFLMTLWYETLQVMAVCWCGITDAAAKVPQREGQPVFLLRVPPGLFAWSLMLEQKCVL